MTSQPGLYAIEDTSKIISPALVVYRELVEQNIQTMLEVAGSAERLRPHCKTHKMSAVTELELQAGITKHKCATIAEAEMSSGATTSWDVVHKARKKTAPDWVPETVFDFSSSLDWAWLNHNRNTMAEFLQLILKRRNLGIRIPTSNRAQGRRALAEDHASVF